VRLGPPRQEGKRMGRTYLANHRTPWKSVVSSRNGVRVEPGQKRFYYNLISADRFC